MSALYRAVLKCYPRWWREQHADEALGLLRDSAEARGRVDLRDLLNLVAHAAWLRLTPSGPPTLVQGIRNRVSLIAMSLLAASCSTLLIFGEWAPWDPRSSMEAAPVANVTSGSICYLAGLLAAIAVAFNRATAGRWLAAFSGVSALAIMWAPIEQLAHSNGFTRPPGTILGFVAVVCALATVGVPRLPRGSRGPVVLLGLIPTIGAVLVTAASLGPEPWFYYRLADQTSVRINGGILLGIGLMVIAVVLLIGGSRVWAAALAVNSMPWLLLVSLDLQLRGFAVLPMGGIGLLAVVIVVALLAGMTAVTISRRLQPAENSVARSE